MNIWYITLLWHERVEFDKKTNKTRYLLYKNTNDQLYILLGNETTKTQDRKIFETVEADWKDNSKWFEGNSLLSYGDIDWDRNIFPEKKLWRLLRKWIAITKKSNHKTKNYTKINWQFII